MQRYRSGYNGTVLKTVVRQRTVGSNPTLCATSFEDNLMTDFSYQCRSTQVGDEAPLLRAQVGKPAREFESLLLRQTKKTPNRVSFLFRDAVRTRTRATKARARNTTAASGGNRKCELAQRSKLSEVNNEQTILGTARGLLCKFESLLLRQNKNPFTKWTDFCFVLFSILYSLLSIL